MIKPEAIRYELVPFTRGRGLQVNIPEEQPKMWPHFTGCDESDFRYFHKSRWDYVILHELRDESLFLKAWQRIRQGGHFILIGENRAPQMMNIKGWDFLLSEKSEDDFIHVYKKRSDKQQLIFYNDERPPKTVLVIRYGAVGDMIQISSIFPPLKKQGYHITVLCQPKSASIIKDDPNVDDIFITDKDQVPNQQLDYHWEFLKTKYDKIINLSESVEGTILALPGRMNNKWPYSARQKYMSINYLEFTHDLAELPYPPFNTKFYPDKKEIQWCVQKRKQIGAGPIIHWVLSGSSIHKTWPYLDQIIARLLVKYPEASIVLTGDEMCKMLQSGWENEKRVHLWAGEKIRNTLTFAVTQADIVIGPETGVINAVGMELTPTIIFLSHSSRENVSKHWVNTISLEPDKKDCPCFPCHRLHYTWHFCNQDSVTGAALCQARINVNTVEEAIELAMSKTTQKAA